MTNFDKWKAKMTVKLAKNINKNMEMCADEDEYEKIPTTENELEIWRAEDNLDDVAQLFSLSDCGYCPVDDTEEGCPASDSCSDDFYEWASSDSSWHENRAEEIAEHEDKVNSFKEIINDFQEAAEQGDAQAQYKVGDSFLELGLLNKSDHNPDEYKQAYLWLIKAAEQGIAEAQVKVGDFYSSFHIDLGIKKDSNKAAYWYAKAAESGFHLGVGQKSQLIKHIIRNEDEEDANVQFKLGNLWLFDCLLEKEYTFTLSWQIEEINYSNAISHFKLAAENGHAGAQNILGQCYFHGISRNNQNRELAFQWYNKAAEQGHAEAQYNLAKCYQEADGVEEDALKAYEWFIKAAEQGQADAQFSLGEYYSTLITEMGVEKDDKKAEYWWKKAAEQGHDEAKFWLEEY